MSMLDNSSIDSVSLQLGVLTGRFDSIEESIRSISDAMQTIAGHSARVDMLEQTRIQHDKRLSKIEGEQIELRERLAQAVETLNKHIEKDTPLNEQLGNWAIGAILFVGGLVVKWVFDNLPEILELGK